VAPALEIAQLALVEQSPDHGLGVSRNELLGGAGKYLENPVPSNSGRRAAA